MLQPKLIYIGKTSSMMPLKMLREAYMIAAVNFKKAQDRQLGKKVKDIPEFKVGDLALLKNHKKSHPLDAKYISNFRICKDINDRVYDLHDTPGNRHEAYVVDIQLLLPVQCLVSLCLMTRLLVKLVSL